MEPPGGPEEGGGDAESTNMSPMPRPGPVPMTRPTDPARAPSRARSGSNTRSASGPARAIAAGEAAWASIRRSEKTRPCMPGVTFNCHRVWLEVFTTGRVSMRAT